MQIKALVGDLPHGARMEANLFQLAAWCGTIPLTGGTIFTLFLAGLVGAPVHCGAMCGGFVLGQVADRMADTGLCEWRRVAAGALPGYHAGRLTVYALLGGLMGFGAAALLPRWFPPVLLLVGAGLFLMRGLMPAVLLIPPGWGQAVGWLSRRARRNPFALGAALGFLPCGFLYAALAVAASARDPVAGGLGMLAFGLGTVPTLLVVGIAGQLAGRRWQQAVARFAPALMVANAVLLAILAVRAA